MSSHEKHPNFGESRDGELQDETLEPISRTELRRQTRAPCAVPIGQLVLFLFLAAPT